SGVAGAAPARATAWVVARGHRFAYSHSAQRRSPDAAVRCVTVLPRESTRLSVLDTRPRPSPPTTYPDQWCPGRRTPPRHPPPPRPSPRSRSAARPPRSSFPRSTLEAVDTLYIGMLDFIERHPPCGTLTADATEPEARGYMLTIACSCGVTFAGGSHLTTLWLT